MKLAIAISVCGICVAVSCYFIALSHRYEVLSDKGAESIIIDHWSGNLK